MPKRIAVLLACVLLALLYYVAVVHQRDALLERSTGACLGQHELTINGGLCRPANQKE